MEEAGVLVTCFGSTSLKYSKSELIACGTFGFVFKAKLDGNMRGSNVDPEILTMENWNEYVAVKEITLINRDVEKVLGDKEENSILHRWKSLTELDHFNILPYYQIQIKKSRCSTTVSIAMEYVPGGDLAALFEKVLLGKERLNSQDMISHIGQLADGLEYLHQENIMHGDIKPANVLMKLLAPFSWRLLIADLDDRAELERSVTQSADVTHIRGTASYMAPEMAVRFLKADKVKPGRKADVWSLGCIMLDMASIAAGSSDRLMQKKGIFRTDTFVITKYTTSGQIMFKIADGYVPVISSSVSKHLEPLIKRCICTSVTDRFTAADVNNYIISMNSMELEKAKILKERFTTGSPGKRGMQRGLQNFSNTIEQRINEGRNDLRNQIKVLLLGTEEAGKSTLIKQMRIIHERNGFSDNERIGYIQHIHYNLIKSIQHLVGAMDVLKISFQDPANEQMYNALLRDIDLVTLHRRLDAERLQAIRTLWLDEGVREAFSHQKDFDLSDSTEYFMERITSRPPTPPPLDLDTSGTEITAPVNAYSDTPVKLPIIDPCYIPRNSDIVRVRVRTWKIKQYIFRVGRAEFRFVDVGGQNTERRKWMHYFDKVSLLMFIASLSDYDQTMSESPGVSRMKESLAFFDDILNYDTGRDPFRRRTFGIWFRDAPVVLYLNKTDLFKDKIKESHLKRYFPDYDGAPCNAEEAKEYILMKYLNTRRVSRDIFAYFTTATDTGQMDSFFNAGPYSILKRTLADFSPL